MRFKRPLLALALACSIPLASAGNHDLIAGGHTHSIFIKDSNVFVSGGDQYGQLGTFAEGDAHAPIPVGIEGASRVAADTYKNLVLLEDGTVAFFGAYKDYQAAPPVRLPLEGIVDVAASMNYAYFLQDEDGDGQGPVIIWDYDQEMLLQQIVGPVDYVKIDGRGYQGGGIDSNGDVWMWGNNNYGQLGNGSFESSGAPVKVEGLPGVAIDLDIGDFHTLVLMSDGDVYAFGLGHDGRLGNGEGMNSSAKWYSDESYRSAEPVKVKNLPYVVGIEAGRLHSAARTSGGEVYVWGYSSYINDSGVRNKSAYPIEVLELFGVDHVGVGSDQTIVEKGGEYYSWGAGFKGKLGVGNTVTLHKPEQMLNPTKSVSALIVSEGPADFECVHPGKAKGHKKEKAKGNANGHYKCPAKSQKYANKLERKAEKKALKQAKRDSVQQCKAECGSKGFRNDRELRMCKVECKKSLRIAKN